MISSFSWQLWYLENSCLECFFCFEDGVSAGCAPATGGLEAAGIDDEFSGLSMADRPVGVAVDHAVGFWKEIPQTRFNVIAEFGSMGQADSEIAQGKSCILCKRCAGISPAHIAANGMDGFVCKDIEYAEICQVAGVDDNLAVGKTTLGQLFKVLVRGA